MSNFLPVYLLSIFCLVSLVACSSDETTGTSSSAIISTSRVIPEGLHCSCGPTNENSSSVFAGAGDIDYLKGILVRVGWGSLEPAPGEYDWTLIDQQIDKAGQQGLKIVLTVVNGPNAPAWLADEGAVTFDYVLQGKARTLPVPWDPVYLSHITEFISALGQRYDGNAAISLIHMTNSTTNGFEMQYLLDDEAENRFLSLGYTEQRLIDSWVSILDAYNQAFDQTLLDVEVHPVFRSPAVARAVAAYGHSTMGDHFGLLAAWFSKHNAENGFQDMYSLLLSSQATSFATVQLVGTASESTAQGSLTTDELVESMQLAIDSGIKYIEVWNNDLINPDLTTELESFAAVIEAL